MPRRAFTLVEIMVVVALVALLSLFSVPNFIRYRITTSESICIANLRTLVKACQMYHIANAAYPEALADLGTPNADPPYIDSLLAGGHKENYDFIYQRTAEGYTINGNPSGIFAGFDARYFYVDQTGIIRSKRGGPAGPGDEIVG